MLIEKMGPGGEFTQLPGHEFRHHTVRMAPDGEHVIKTILVHRRGAADRAYYRARIGF